MNGGLPDSMLPDSLERHIARDLPTLRVSADPADRVAYARDLWPRHHLAVRRGHVADHRPGVVVWPESTADVVALVRWANDARVPLVPFGAGSGVCAGILPREDVVVVDMKRMARWRHLDSRAPTLDVEAGHMGVPLEEGLGRHGLTLGHFPSSILCSSVGGWAATRSAGQCSGYYGKIEDMVVALECVTGEGEAVTLRRRAHGPDLTPLMVGSEGTLGVVTSVTLRLHAAPTSRAFGAWSFPSTESGWEGMRALFQAGLRPAVSRLYDPFDAMLAKRSAGKTHRDRSTLGRVGPTKAPGLGAAALRGVLRYPRLLNELIEVAGARALGGSMLVVIFEGSGAAPSRDMDEATAMLAKCGGRSEGETPARHWLEKRYSVSYRQAPVFASGAFADTMEVATTWSNLGRLYDAVRLALGKHVFVVAHLSHAYPDGCCIYFSFAGSAQTDGSTGEEKGWDEACEATYDRAWREALRAAVEAGGTLAHHHGAGRSKAPRLSEELGVGLEVVRDLKDAFDPRGILNPGNLIPPRTPRVETVAPPPDVAPRFSLDETSLLAHVPGEMTLSEVEERLGESRLTLDVLGAHDSTQTVASWLAEGARGARDAWRDPADHLLAGLRVKLIDGRSFDVRPAPRRAVGPDLVALVLGMRERFAKVERAWLRVHKVGTKRADAGKLEADLDPVVSDGETALIEAIASRVTPRGEA